VRNAAKAIEFYKKVFGAEERFRMHGLDGKTIMHADLKIGDSVFMLTEESTEMKTLLNLYAEVQLACIFMLRM
jgi:PhnB protein